MLRDITFSRATGIHHYTLFLQFGRGKSAKLGLDNAGRIPMHFSEPVASDRSENNV